MVAASFNNECLWLVNYVTICHKKILGWVKNCGNHESFPPRMFCHMWYMIMNKLRAGEIAGFCETF